MFFVHVISRPDLFVSIPQFESKIRVAFQIHRRGNFVECGQREHLAHNFEHENVVAKRRALSCAILLPAIFAKFR